MSSSEIPVDSLVYRVACRFGILDPTRHRYTGPGSPGDVRIQDFGRLLHPHNPSLLDEPMWMMGRNARMGGYCHPTTPRCDAGCIFAGCCPRLWREQDPTKTGYHAAKQPSERTATAAKTRQEATGPSRQVPGLLVIVGCGKRKIWDVDAEAPQRVQCDSAYRGSFFLANRAYALAFGHNWCVLPAKYGFIWAEEDIEDYDVTFNKRGSEVVSPDELRAQVKSKHLQEFGRVQVLAGRAYVDRVRYAFEGTGLQIEAPIAGRGMFEARRIVARATQTGSPFSLNHEDLPASNADITEDGTSSVPNDREGCDKGVLLKYSGSSGLTTVERHASELLELFSDASFTRTPDVFRSILMASGVAQFC